jgi:hypothetical protein
MRVAEAVRDAFVEAAEKRALELADLAFAERRPGVRARHEAEAFGRNQEAAYMKIANLAALVARVAGERS